MFEDKRKLAEDKVNRIKAGQYKMAIYSDVRPITDIKDMFYSSSNIFSDRIAFYEKNKSTGKYEGIKYSEAKEAVNALGTSLQNLGMKNKRIAIIGENRYYWAISYLACVCGDSVAVPLDKELSKEDLMKFISDAEVSCVICSNRYESIFLDALNDNLSSLEIIINMDRELDAEGILSFNNLLSKGYEEIKNGNTEFEKIVPDPDALAVLIFTSGTTGMSKGVMLSHHSIAHNLMSMISLLYISNEDIFFSVLPIHHTYECTCGFLCAIYRGAAIAYCEGLKFILKNLAEIKPTVFLCVPLIMEGIYKKIWIKIRKSGKEKQIKKILWLNSFTKKIGIDLNKILLKDISAALGGRMRLMISGGASIDPSILKGFRDFSIAAVQGYGLTECSPILALNPGFAPVDTAAGYPLPDQEVSIYEKSEDGIGEIICRGENIMLGYYKNEEATKEVLREGWFHTGDLGYLDNEGYVHITGRKKSVIIAKNGKNVFPEEIENYLSKISYVEESMVFGKEDSNSGETFIYASIKPNMEELEIELKEKITDEEIEKFLWLEIDKINKSLPMFKKIRKIIIKNEFDKTTGNKIKRFSEKNK